MSKRSSFNYLPLVLTAIAFTVIVFILKYTEPTPNPAIAPTPLPSSSLSPAKTPLPSTPVSALASPVTNTTGPAITFPVVNTKVTSPLIVTGVVPAGWMFEGSLPIKLVDKQQNLIVQGIATEKTPGSWSSGQPVAFTATLTFTTDAKSGFLVLEKDNPSGLPENADSYQIPLKFSN